MLFFCEFFSCHFPFFYSFLISFFNYFDLGILVWSRSRRTLFTNFAPWRKMKAWEFGLADGAYSGRPHVVAPARKPLGKEFGRTASTYNDTHAFFRSRVEQLYAIFWTFAIVRAPWRGHGEAGMEKLFRRMKVLINLVAFYLRRFQKYELVGPWRHDPDVKQKAKGPKPSASTSHPSSSSIFSSTWSSSAPQSNNFRKPPAGLRFCSILSLHD